MTPYVSTSGKRSGVTAFEIGETFIDVMFHKNVYRYSYKSCDPFMVEKMKELALASKGLSTFIAQEKPAYEWKH